MQDPLDWKPNNSYQVRGQVLVHELTHAWQIHHASFLPGFVCAGIVNQANYQVGQSVYQYGLQRMTLVRLIWRRRGRL